MSSIEILSPAGSFEALKAAVDSGANAVYFGGRAFSARKNAVNLSNDEILKAVSYAHLRGAKLYAAVNTLMFDNELNLAFEFIKFCYEANVDAIIVQDLGLAHIIKKHFPDFRMHASTQMTIHNLSGVLEAQKLGFSRVVLSRELSFEDIKYIAQNTDMELEVFVHGALCMSYSGQCLFSSFLGGRSGNRGGCAQPCRLPYTLYNSFGEALGPNSKYLLSLKDLCLIDYISKLKEIGVTSLKIEGRMKSAAYVSAVTGIYNKYRNGGVVKSEDRALLTSIFSRSGFTDGYLKSTYGRDMLSFEKNHDDIFENVTAEVLNDAYSLANIQRKTYINASFVMKKGEKIYFEAEYDGKIFSATGDTVADTARNMSVDALRIESQLRKLGSTVLEYKSLVLDVEEGLYIPIKEVNKVRREVCEKIELSIADINRSYKGEAFVLPKKERLRINTPKWTASVLNEKQADICFELGFSKIFIPYSLYKSKKSKFDAYPDIFSVKLPPVNHDRGENNFSDISVNSVCITNIGQVGKINQSLIKHADYRLNVCNSFSYKKLIDMGFNSVCLSLELTIRDIRSLRISHGAEILVYGKPQLMTVKNCLVKSSLGKCGCKDGEMYYLKDRKKIVFPVECQKGECVNVIYNSAPIYMADRLKDLENTGAKIYRFDFTDETTEEIKNIFNKYKSGKKSDTFFTRGHYYNGVL